MFSARKVFEEIFDNDEAFGLFCSIAASGEGQGGWENGRIAALVPGSQAHLAPKIARHGADEDKHGRIFTALLRKRGLTPVGVPADTDYTMWLEKAGIGLAHARLRGGEKLTERDIVTYLAHSRVTEQRASEQMRALRKYAAGRPDIARAVKVISADEDNHLAYCHEELLRLAAAEGRSAGRGHPGGLRLGAARRLAAHGVAAHAGPAQRAERPGAPRSLRLIPAPTRYHPVWATPRHPAQHDPETGGHSPAARAASRAVAPRPDPDDRQGAKASG